MKKFLRSFLVFSCVFALFLLIVYLLYAGLTGSLLAAPNHTARVYAFSDSNANGIQDPGEGPQAGVCVYTSPGPRFGSHALFDPCDSPDAWRTDAQGIWTHDFPNVTCDEQYVVVVGPPGTRDTTVPAAYSCNARFGLAPPGVYADPPFETEFEFIQKELINYWALRLGLGFAVFLAAVLVTARLEKWQ